MENTPIVTNTPEPVLNTPLIPVQTEPLPVNPAPVVAPALTPNPVPTPTVVSTPPPASSPVPGPVPMQKSSMKMPALIVVIVLLLLAVGLGAYYFSTANPSQDAETISPDPTISVAAGEIMCTMEIKICPDGSPVSRTGPNCEFTECPASAPTVSVVQNDTSTWESYANTDYGFSFKHPQDWEVRDLMPANPEDFPKRKFWIGYAPKTVAEDVVGMIEITSYTVSEKMEEFRRINSTSTAAKVLLEEKKVMIAGIDATELTVVNTTTNKTYTYLFFSHKGNTFQVTNRSDDSAVVAQISELLSLQ